MRQVFLDHQSSTPVAPEVFEAMKPFFSESFGSPASFHRHGLQARDALLAAREQMAAFLNAESPDDIIFTSGGTESANLAVKGTAYAGKRKGNHIVVTEIEHPAVLNSVEFLEKQGFTATRVKVDGAGRVDPAAVRAAITEATILVCVHHANHDIGTIEPIRAIADITGDAGIPLFVDAVASAGWLKVDVRELGASLLSLSPHRWYGPKGVGVLYRHRRARVASVLHGGVQEAGRRAGTENMPAIVGAGVAATLATRELPNRQALTKRLQVRLLEGLRRGVTQLTLNGPEPGPERLATNLNLSAAYTEGEGQALLCDMRGIAIASGASCVSKAAKVSPVLTAIGLESSLAQASIIMSLGKDSSEEDMDYVIATYPQVIERLRSLSPLWPPKQKA